MPKDIDNPIIIVGTGRCGSTILHRALSHHRHLAWLSGVCETKPHAPRANWRAMRALDLPLPSRYLRKLIYPVEAYPFWEYYCPGFTEPCRDLFKDDVTPRTVKAVRGAMAQTLTQKRCRLLLKITGWPRIGFLREIFPKAKFIHVYRDGRAVVNSLLSVTWWSGWRGPANWRWGELTSEQSERWEKHGKSFLALAAIEWEILMAAQKHASLGLPSSDLLEIRYEDLCQDPVGTLQRLAQFSGLRWSSDFATAIQRFSFENTNYKWREQLSAAQQRTLNECLGDTLRKYGYG